MTAELEPKILGLSDTNVGKMDGILSMSCSRDLSNYQTDFSEETYWSLSVSNIHGNIMPPIPTINGTTFHIFSDLVSTTSISFNVQTFYFSFVLVFGLSIRGFISGEAEKIVVTETPEPKKILNLCEGIKISRYRHDFIR